MAAEAAVWVTLLLVEGGTAGLVVSGPDAADLRISAIATGAWSGQRDRICVADLGP